MNANAPTFTPGSSSSTTALADNTNTKEGGSSSAKPNGKSYNNAPRQAQSSTRTRFTAPAAGATNHHHQINSNKGNNPTAVKNKTRRHPRNASSSSSTEQSDMLEIEDHHRHQDTGDKKGRVSLNHLLSFSFPERQQQPSYTPRRHKPTTYQPFNKERFVNANFRFVVKPFGNYLANIIEPDSSFDWDNIEQVLITGEEALSCPICLSPPTAARVTKCGHAFCLNCILHYLDLREPKKRWRKCPICWESVYAKDLKSVRSVHPFAVSRPTQSSTTESSSSSLNGTTITSTTTTTATNFINVTEGDTVELCLMQRSSKSTLALPLSDTWPIDDDLYNKHQHRGDTTSLTLMPWHFTPNVMLFGRFMLASPDYLLMENDRDIRELKSALKDAKEWGSTEDMPFIEAGLRQLGLEAEAIGAMYSNKSLENAVQAAEHLLEQAKTRQSLYSRQHQQKEDTIVKSSTAPQIIDRPSDPVNEDDIPEAYKQHHLQRAGTDDTLSLTTTTTGSNTTINQQRQLQQHQRQSPTTEFYFYQAKDGQHIYLHPLDIRILKYEYGDYQNFPPVLQVKTRGVEETTLTEDIRHRCKYIGHLPLACDVTFIEVDIKPLVSKQTFNHFQGELKMRNKKRQDRIKREEKAIKISAKKQQIRQVQDTRREEQARMEDDPFFKTYQPMTLEENDRMLKEALEISALEAQQHQHQPKTVWGTPAVTNEQPDAQPQEWAEHIVITQGRRKPKGKRK
ncbi:hypothetical protein BC941DRAFT_430640 [Chlamydoabsidia padenii]|nr:hypothetical protein BC941DRAFT_430640 [Chlamydoabsidia padenii]